MGKNTITKMPRPRAPTTIVEANDVLDLDVIALENWTLMTLLAENLNCGRFLTNTVRQLRAFEVIKKFRILTINYWVVTSLGY